MTKYTKIFPVYFLLFLFSLALVSCNDDDDVDDTPPAINLIEPADDEILYIGSDIHFECEFSDDVELKSYKVEVHSNFDGHDHEKSASFALAEEDGVAWSFSKTWTFEEGQRNSLIHHHEIVIPENIGGSPVAHGNYHLGIYCTDVAGNESNIFIDVVLEEGEGEHDH